MKSFVARLSGPTRVALAGLLLLVAWDLSDLDLRLARLSGDAAGFAWRDHWLLSQVLHDFIKPFPWIAALLLFGVGLAPRMAARVPSLARRLQWPVTALVCSVVIGILKARSGTSCPWELQEFGGVAQHVSHWRGWFVPDGGSGRCFPAGHATNGFAFLGGWFALRGTFPRAAKIVLVASIVVGVLLGVVQQVRGAHFVSHTLWTAWLCWTTALLIDRGVQWLERRPARGKAVGAPLN